MKKFLYVLPFIVILLSCAKKQADLFYRGFVDPPAEARPFVRWWWNGNHIEAEEIKRELDVLKKAGIGGVEINPIAMPDNAKDIGTEPVKWLSKEWNDLLALACREAQDRDMIVDMVAGSGWPFGGEFLQHDEYSQRVSVKQIQVNGPVTINQNYSSLLDLFKGRNRAINQAISNEVLFISLVPVHAADESEVIDLMDHYNNNKLQYSFDQGSYELVCGILSKGYQNVHLGTLGASGKVMDHYRKDVTNKYLNCLKKISEDTSIPLKKLLRALFCDSIELLGANWTGQFLKIFEDAYGYSLKPYLSFIFYSDQIGYQENEYQPEFREKLKRVRYDYNRLLVKVFLDNFTRTFQDFCTANGLLCRYQAYGYPFLMGIMEGNMISDIPEGNTWIYTAEMDAPKWNWNQKHGYMIWNNYAASGGHLRGKKVISCEAMTNTRGIYKTSLEEIKQHDDMSFISGITHSVLHGFNYSPPEAGFPGWLRFGSYFSEQNTWWPYFYMWVDYNARLSYVFQQTDPVKRIAVLGPEGDIWSENGLIREPFHLDPWYCHRLWESLSQAGSSCHYISEKIIQKGNSEKGLFLYGQMKYEAFFLCSIQSLEPATALALKEYIKNGGHVIAIDSIPNRSLSFQNFSSGDEIVQTIFSELSSNYFGHFIKVNSPKSANELLSWTIDLLNKTGISKDVKISKPDPALYQIHQEKGKKDIYFFTNTRRDKKLCFIAEFPEEDNTPWVWNPQTGKRNVYPYFESPNRLNITLNPLESLLLVFEPDLKGKPDHEVLRVDNDDYQEPDNQWELTFHHTNGEVFEHTFDTLKEFNSTGDSLLQSFAGQVIYETLLETDNRHNILKLNEVNKGITEVYVNDEKVGVKWYGNHTYDLEPYINSGKNKLKIIYTTVLSNYCRHLGLLDEISPLRSGIEGPVRLYAKKN